MSQKDIDLLHMQATHIKDLKADARELQHLFDNAGVVIKHRNTQIADLKHRLEKAGNRITEVSRGETETR